MAISRTVTSADKITARIVQPGMAASTELTIASGAITPTRGAHTVDTESDAATDDLDTITATNFQAGDTIYLSAAHTDRTVVIKHNTGNIQTETGEDYPLDDTVKTATLRYDGTNWNLVAGGRAVATQEEAEAGTNNEKVMTPLRTIEQVTANIATQAEADAGTSTSKLITPSTLFPSIIANRGRFVNSTLTLDIGEAGQDWSSVSEWQAWLDWIRVAGDANVISQVDGQLALTKQIVFNHPNNNRLILRGKNSDRAFATIATGVTIDSTSAGNHLITIDYPSHGLAVGDYVIAKPSAVDASGDANFLFMEIAGVLKVNAVPDGDTLQLLCTSQTASLTGAALSSLDIVRLPDRLTASGTKQTLNDADRNDQVQYNDSTSTDDTGIIEVSGTAVSIRDLAIDYVDASSVGQSGNSAYDEITGVTLRRSDALLRRVGVYGMPRNGIRALRSSRVEVTDCGISNCNTLDNSGNAIVAQTYASVTAQGSVMLCGNAGGGLQIRSSSAKCQLTQPIITGNLTLGARGENNAALELANPFIFGNPVGIELETSSKAYLVFNSSVDSQIRASTYALDIKEASEAHFAGSTGSMGTRIIGTTNGVRIRDSVIFGPEGTAASEYYNSIDNDGTGLIDRIAPASSDSIEEIVVDWTSVTPNANPYTFFDATTLESGVYRIQWMRDRTTGTAFTEFFLSIVGPTAGSRTFAGTTSINLGISITLDNGSDVQINGANGDASQYRVLRVKQRTNTPGGLL